MGIAVWMYLRVAWVHAPRDTNAPNNKSNPKQTNQFVLQQWLSFAYHVARAHPGVETLALSSWKRSTFTLVKELCPPPATASAMDGKHRARAAHNTQASSIRDGTQPGAEPQPTYIPFITHKTAATPSPSPTPPSSRSPPSSTTTTTPSPTASAAGPRPSMPPSKPGPGRRSSRLARASA